MGGVYNSGFPSHKDMSSLVATRGRRKWVKPTIRGVSRAWQSSGSLLPNEKGSTVKSYDSIVQSHNMLSFGGDYRSSQMGHIRDSRNSPSGEDYANEIYNS